MSAHSKISAARTSLVLEQPFFGALALSLKVVEDTTCETAWTDGRSLGYSPTFVESLSHDRLTALVAHEVMHCAMGHPWRRDGRNPKGWNVACDQAINGELRASFTLPDGALYPNPGDEGKSSEWYYARVQEDDNGDEPGQGTPDPLGEVRDAPTGPDADGDPAPTEQEWKQNAASAMQQAKMQGKMPGGLAREISQALQPKVDIRSLLLRFFSERSTGDYSWTRPNTRYIAQGLYLPCLESKELGEIAIAIDTSGSVNATSLAYARSIVESTIEEVSPLAVTVYYFDSRVHAVDRFEKGEPLTWKPQGGGGTSFVEVLDAIEKEGTAVCALVITDLEGTFPESCGMPVLWLATEEHDVPFGENIYLDR
jgi:predicted metal-dependent peptidase